MANALTEAQRQILQFISLSMLQSGSTPSLSEIANAFNISPTGAFYHLKALEKKGHITISRGKARSIKILDPSFNHRADILSIPLYKTMPYSDQLEEQTNSENIQLSTLLLDKDKKYFCIAMDSNQMENAGIIKGDKLIFERVSSACDNDIVAVSPGVADSCNEIMIRRLRLSRGRYELIPECDTIGALICQECHIYGILRNLVRAYER